MLLWLTHIYIGAADASLTGMAGVCCISSGECHMWRLEFSTVVQANIITDDKPQIFLMINNLELAEYIYHFQLSTPCMAPLEKISTGLTTHLNKYGPGKAASELPPQLPPFSVRQHRSHSKSESTRTYPALQEWKK